MTKTLTKEQLAARRKKSNERVTKIYNLETKVIKENKEAIQLDFNAALAEKAKKAREEKTNSLRDQYQSGSLRLGWDDEANTDFEIGE